MIESWLRLETHCLCFPARGVDSKVGLCRVLGHWLSLLKESDPLYESILECLTSRPSEANAFLCWWGFDQDLNQDLTLNLGRQGSAPGYDFSKAEELGPSPDNGAKAKMDL